ncbi:hypothetical protein MNB_SV-14-1150 [hydrothermal vent metagenome]|uniref:Uncharacterized protein n=1 Tax=hydrothermal vent metagenome TaxID=652676 RepID=A0A1W1CG37_9ZZZZ
MLKKINLILIITVSLWASDIAEEVQHIKKPPVDEGHNLKPKPDKVKGVTFVNTEESNTTTTLSLEKEDEIIVIKFESTSHVPLTCKIIREKREVFSIEKEPKDPRVSRALEFEIKKSKLQLNDEIVISNNSNINIRTIEVKK